MIGSDAVILVPGPCGIAEDIGLQGQLGTGHGPEARPANFGQNANAAVAADDRWVIATPDRIIAAGELFERQQWIEGILAARADGDGEALAKRQLGRSGGP